MAKLNVLKNDDKTEYVCAECKRILTKPEKFCPTCGSKLYLSTPKKVEESAFSLVQVEYDKCIKDYSIKENFRDYDVFVETTDNEIFRIKVADDFVPHCVSKYKLVTD